MLDNIISYSNNTYIFVFDYATKLGQGVFSYT